MLGTGHVCCFPDRRHVEVELAEGPLPTVARLDRSSLRLPQARILCLILREFAVRRLAALGLALGTRGQRQVQRLLKKLLHALRWICRRRALQRGLQEALVRHSGVFRAPRRLRVRLLRRRPRVARLRSILHLEALLPIGADPELRHVDLSALNARRKIMLVHRVAGLLGRLRMHVHDVRRSILKVVDVGRPVDVHDYVAQWEARRRLSVPGSAAEGYLRDGHIAIGLPPRWRECRRQVRPLTRGSLRRVASLVRDVVVVHIIRWIINIWGEEFNFVSMHYNAYRTVEEAGLRIELKNDSFKFSKNALQTIINILLFFCLSRGRHTCGVHIIL